MSDHFTIRRQEHGVFISCSPDAVDDLAEALAHLVGLARTLKVKAQAAQAEREIAAERERARALIAYRDTSEQVYSEFVKFLQEVKSEKVALQRTRDLFKMKMVDVRGYVREGKQIITTQNLSQRSI